MCSPPARVDRLSGCDLDPKLLRSLVELTWRNMQGFAGRDWDAREKRNELANEDTCIIAVRSPVHDLLGFAAYRLVHEEGVLVAYVYELQLEVHARGMRLGSSLLAAVEGAARTAGASGLMLTVHKTNAAARRFYESHAGFELSPLSPAMCAPPAAAAACDYEIMQRIWDAGACHELSKSGAEARRYNWLEAMESGDLVIRLVRSSTREQGSRSAAAIRRARHQ
jgi:ribosomal protein S18 acetylase RimI-like enzyme